MDSDQVLHCLSRIDDLMNKHMPLDRLRDLMLLNDILMLVVVGVGAYAPRYCHHPLVGLVFLGANILFLPIVSYVASAFDNMVVESSFLTDLHVVVRCIWGLHIVLVEVWTGLVLITGINTSSVVAGDAREGKNSSPPTELFIKAFWLGYLTLSTPGSTYGSLVDGAGKTYRVESATAVIVQLFVIIFAKLFFKFSAFYKARRSFALGRCPRLVAGYMAQLQKSKDPTPHQTDGGQQPDSEQATTPPALLVLGEDTVDVEDHPHGYNFIEPADNVAWRKMRKRLVTLDRVWQLSSCDGDDMILWSQPRKDLCFSFALFKLLRCHFASYTPYSKAGFIDAHKFFRDELLQGYGYERVFQVISDELSFTHDYYYSSLPISYSHHLFPILSITLSLYTICYCLYLVQFITRQVIQGNLDILCLSWCQTTDRSGSNQINLTFPLVYDLVTVGLVLAVLVLAETREIISYMCSNWTKVAVICHYVSHSQPSRQQSPAAQRRISFVLERCRSKLVNSWADKMNQSSVLVLPPRKISIRVRQLFGLPNQKNIKVPGAVKEAIFEALKRLKSEQDGQLILKHIRPPSHPIPGGNPEAIRDGQHTAHTILVWHVATSVVETSHPPQQADGNPNRRHGIAATHLSRYCAYLVGFCPELLPGDDKWSKKLYKDVKKDADRVLAAAAPQQQLVELLGAESNHEVLRNGVVLGKQLMDSGMGWEALARFWSEMALYVAPSENLDGHVEAIARGGELVTLLWTLLGHAGIVGRLDTTSSAASAGI